MGFAVALGACTEAAQPPAKAQAAVVPHQRHAAQQLLVDTASCWFGGMWGDVQGQTPQEREASSQRRCEGVVLEVFGRADHERYLQLHAFEPTTLALVKRNVVSLAKADPVDAPNAAVRGKMFTALADAEYDTALVRQAATRIQRDVTREPEKLSYDESVALPQLEVKAGFDELFQLDAGKLQHEARALVLLVTLDRIRAAEGLPVHLKPYAVSHALNAVFGVPVPDMPHDASRPLAPGAWLAYLTNAAAVAGHPVPDVNAPPRARQEAAVAGILLAIADRLRAEVDGIGPDTPLAKMTRVTIHALEQSRERAGT